MDRKCNIIEDNDGRNKIALLKSYISEEKLIEISNKGTYKRGTKDAESVTEAEISYSDSLVQIKYDDVLVSSDENLSKTSCSCKSKTVCRHVITALLILNECEVSAAETPVKAEENQDISDEETEIPDKSISKSTSDGTEPDFAYLSEVTEYISLVMKKGIMSCDKTDIDIAAKLSVRGENTLHNNISLMMRNFSVQIENMINRNAEFSAVRVFHLISRIYNTASAVIANKDNAENLKTLCPLGRETYESREVMTFYGLGAYPWVTGSGYAGVTALIYCEDDRKVYTYSSSVAYIHDKTQKFAGAESLLRLFLSRSHWQNSVSVSQISKSAFRLMGCKTNILGRISSSKNTAMNILGPNTFYKTELMYISPEKMLESEEEYDYFSEKNEEKVCALRAERFENVVYNKIRQVLEFDIVYEHNTWPCEIVWSEHNKKAVAFVENTAKTGIRSRSFIICRYYNGIYTPVSIINDECVRNICFE